MNILKQMLIHVATSAIVLATLVFVLVPVSFGQSRAVEIAAPEYIEDGERVQNSVIDCSTNSAFRQGEYGEYAQRTGHQDCSSCHRSRRPQAGRGDRPRPKFGSFAIQNKNDEPIDVEIKAGKNGEWTEYDDVAPGKILNVSWQYSNPGENESPRYFVRQNGKVYEPKLLATPNEQLGNLHYFEKDARSDELKMRRPKRKPYRR